MDFVQTSYFVSFTLLGFTTSEGLLGQDACKRPCPEGHSSGAAQAPVSGQIRPSLLYCTPYEAEPHEMSAGRALNLEQP